MATATPPSTGQPKQPAAPPPAVIRSPALNQRTGVSMMHLVPAYILSILVHVGLLLLFLLINVTAKAEHDQEPQVIETKVEDNPQDLNLTNDEIGLDPEIPTNYDIARIEEVSVPGPVNPTEAVGILNAPEAVPETIPPPPGVGRGQGGAPDGVGAGNPMGFAGGFQGLYQPGGFGGRSGATRERMVKEGGGNTRSEAAVAAGLKWLSQHQNQVDGSWSMDKFSTHGRCNCGDAGREHGIAGTAFGLLPFLGAGETHKKGGMYSKTVENALKYLIMKQNREGSFGGRNYEQGIASIAICEAYGLTSDPVLKGPAQRAVNYVVSAQTNQGGWDYTKNGQTSDTSVAGWNVQALKSGQMSGLSVPRESLARVSKYLDAFAGDSYGATYGYRSPGKSANLSAVGLLCRQYLGWGPRNPGLIKGVELLMSKPPSTRDKRLYYYYYATQVVHHIGGEQWQTWNNGEKDKPDRPGMRDLLVDSQDQGREPGKQHQKGSWTSQGWDTNRWGGGRIMTTSLALLTLEVYYRHLPLYRREMGAAKDDDVQAGL
ncbi:MAG: prenyltransferase/squalene oxidase repeat-containing protein [Gemmataceae bacterium]